VRVLHALRDHDQSLALRLCTYTRMMHVYLPCLYVHRMACICIVEECILKPICIAMHIFQCILDALFDYGYTSQCMRIAWEQIDHILPMWAENSFNTMAEGAGKPIVLVAGATGQHARFQLKPYCNVSISDDVSSKLVKDSGSHGARKQLIQCVKCRRVPSDCVCRSAKASYICKLGLRIVYPMYKLRCCSPETVQHCIVYTC
jgi:hypothetical protein